MRKILLSILIFCANFITVQAQNNCIPVYQTGCSSMYIDGIQLDSINTNYVVLASYPINTGTGCNSGNISGYSATNSGTLKIFAGSWYKLSVSTQIGYLGAVGVFIDFNGDGVFNPSNELIQSANYNSSGFQPTQIYFAVPSYAKAGKTKMRVVTYGGGNYNSITDPCFDKTINYGEAEDYEVNIVVPPKTLKSVIVNPQSLDHVYQKSESNNVLTFNVETEGVEGDLFVNKVSFVADNIDSVLFQELNYWENGFYQYLPGLDYIKTAKGFDIIFLNPKKLNSGTNYFALYYNFLPSPKRVSARVSLDVMLTDIEVDNISRKSLITPQKNIIQLVPKLPIFNSSFCFGTSLVQNFNIGQMSDSYNSRTTDCNATISSLYSPSAVLGTTVNSVIKLNKPGYNAAMFFDWDGDLQFNSINEFLDLGEIDSVKATTSYIQIPNVLADSNIFVRLLVTKEKITKESATGDFTFSSFQGESRDYFLRVKQPTKPTNFIESVQYYQFDSLLVVKGDSNVNAMTIVVNADTASVINLATQSFKINTGNTPLGTISKAKLWYGGALNGISLAKQIGTTVINPNGTFSFDIPIKIASGKNYFFVTYDISNSAAFNTIVEAKLDNISFDNGNSVSAKLDSIFTIGQIKVVEYIRLTNGVISSGCDILFTDNGGKSGTFKGKGTQIHEFKASGINNTLKLKINNLDLGYLGDDGRLFEDTLFVYDGLGATKTLAKAITQSVFWFELGGNYEFTSTSGNLTFEFKSDTNSTKHGWESFIKCVYNCSKFPITTNFTVDSVLCVNEKSKVFFEILTSKTAKYKVSYFDWNTFNQVNIDIVKDTFSLHLTTKGQSPNIKITNENNCSVQPAVILPRKSVDFNLYYEDYSRDPSCKIANDGFYNYNVSSSNPDALFSLNWKSIKSGKNIGSKQGVKGENYFTVNKLMYDTLYQATFSSSEGGCIVEYINIKPGRTVYYDSTTSVPQSYTPISDDTVFVIGQKVNSLVSVKFLDYFPRLTSGVKNDIYPDSAKWIVRPISLKNTINNSTDSTQVSNFEWNSNFSGNLNISAQLYKSGCKGPISEPLNFKIYPNIVVDKDSLVNYNPKDSSIFDLQLKGSQPFVINLKNNKDNTVQVYKKISSSTLNLKLPIGEYEIVSITDSFGLVNNLKLPIKVVSDTIYNLNYTLLSPPACAGKTAKIKFDSKGGKSPVIYKVYDLLNNEIASGDSVYLYAGQYVVKATDASGFLSKPENVFITNPSTNTLPVPTISSPVSPFITNVDTLSLNVKANLSVPFTYKKVIWSITPSNILTASDTTLASILTLNNSSSGNFYLRANIVDDQNCISDSSNIILIQRQAKASFTFADTSLFIGDSVQFALNFKGSLPGKIKYQIGKNEPLIKEIINPTSYFSVKNEGQLTILGLVDIDSVNVIFEQPKINFILDTISKVALTVDSITCANSTGFASVSVLGGKPDYTLTVYDLNDVIIGSNIGLNPKIALPLGNYKATVKDANGFYNKDTLYFDIKNGQNPYRNLKPIFKIKPTDSIPAGTLSSNFEVELPGINSALSYEWYYSNSLNSILNTNQNGSQNVVYWKNRFSGEVDFKVVASVNSCKSDTGYFKIKVKPTVKILQNSNGDVLVKFYGTSPFRINYNFDNTSQVNLESTSDSSTILIPKGASKLFVTLVADANFNSGFGAEFEILNDGEVEIFEAFSPNGDKLNETFVVKNLPSIQAKFQVFDRNGFVVYNNSNYKNDWNGNDNNGNPVADGVYFFVLILNDIDKTRYSGPIEIRR